MLKISEKGKLLPASPIRKLVPYAEKAKAQGVKVFHLNIGQPDIETPSCALDAVANMSAQIIEYTHSAGNISYRRALSDFYSNSSRKISTEQIIVTTGGSEAALFAMMATANPGDEIIIPEPFYANYNSFAIEAGVTIVPITSSIESGFALPSIAEFEKLMTPKTRAILICNPNNPTGYLYSYEELTALRDLIVKHDLYLISDEVYSDFCYDDCTFTSTLDLEGADPNVIVIDSVSKRYSMCGARIGALVSRNENVIDAVLRMGQARLCAPFIGQIAAEAATRFTPQSYFDNVKKEYLARRDFTISALNKMEGVICPKPSGAFYAIASLPVDSAENFSKWLLEEFSFNNTTVMLAPAQGFYSDHCSCPQNQVRIAYVLKLEDLKGAMIALETALKQYPNRTNI